MKLVPIPTESIPKAWWNRIAPFAAQIAERFPEDWPVPVTAMAASTGDLTLWSIWAEEEKRPYGCVATRISIKANGRRILDIAWVAGAERELWLPLRADLERWAVEEKGCSGVRISGRYGWKPDLPDYRCEKMAIYEKDLTVGG